jgi:hypothetical protein
MNPKFTFQQMAYGVNGTLARLYQSTFDSLPGTTSVTTWGAKGDGVTDDTESIQDAIASFGSTAGTLYFPAGDYLISSPLKISLTGMILEGESAASTYLLTPNGSTFDILKVAGAYSEVRGLLFRPGGDQYCIRVYAAHATIENNRFLADVDGTGTAILLTDTDPDTSAFVAGAYTHTIFNNLFGTSGYAFARGIDEGSASGITACKFIGNQFWCDRPIRISKGGGNTYFGNLLQSATGTGGTPVGVGIDLGTNVVGEMITGNYFERFAQATLLRRLVDTAVGAVVQGNHYDNNTSNLTSSGIANYQFDNTDGNYRVAYGWQTEAVAATHKFYTPGGTTIQTFDTTGRTTFGRPIGLKSFTVATLPAGTQGDLAYCTDLTAPTYLGALVGGGAVKALVFFNGSAWVSC